MPAKTLLGILQPVDTTFLTFNQHYGYASRHIQDYQRQSSERSTQSDPSEEDGKEDDMVNTYCDAIHGLSSPQFNPFEYSTPSSFQCVLCGPYNDRGHHRVTSPPQIDLEPVKVMNSNDNHDYKTRHPPAMDKVQCSLSPPRIVIHPALSEIGDDGGGHCRTIEVITGQSALESEDQAELSELKLSRKTRSSISRPLRVVKSPKPIKTKRSTQLSKWSSHLDNFLTSAQNDLINGHGTVILTTYPNGVTVANKLSTSRTIKTRSARKPNISTHRFILPIKVSEAPRCDWLSVSRIEPSQSDLTTEYGCYFISCVLWQKQLWITNSDICHIVKFRLEAVGFEVIDREKLFEGVYSDLRVIPKTEFRYEEAKGAFLNALDEFGCISMHKRQKLYRWSSVPHHQLFRSALRRSAQGGRACKAARGVAVKLCRGETSIEISSDMLKAMLLAFAS